MPEHEERERTVPTYPEPAPRPQEVEFRKVGVPPATARYIGREDRLVLRTHNDVATLVVTVRGRYMTPEGLIVPFAQEQRPPAGGAVTTTRIELGEGYLLSLAVQGSVGVTRRGATFVTVALDRGGAVGGLFVEVLVSDYLVEEGLLGWPGGLLRQSIEGPGLLRSVTGTNPAAGAEISQTVPTNARWRLYGFRAQLVTAVAAATRRVHLVIDDGATTLLDLAAQDTQVASLTRNYNCSADGYSRTAADFELYIPLPSVLELFQGWRIRTATTSLQAADDWGAPQMLVEELRED